MDASVLIALQSLRFEGLTQLMALLSALGNGGFVWFVIGVVMLFFARDRPAALATLLSSALSVALVYFALAGLFSRVPPCDANIGVSAVLGVSHACPSFPSIHATAGAAATTSIAMLRGKGVAIPVGLLSALIMFSRLFCGVSYPSDVLAGIVLGVVLGIVVSWLLNRAVFSLTDGKASSGSLRKRTSVGSGRHSRY